MKFSNLIVQLIFIIFLIKLNVNALGLDDDKKIFCMYLLKSAGRSGEGNFQVEDINENLCTHLIYAYFGVEDDGKIKSLDPLLDYEENFGRGNIRKFNNKKHYNTNLKTIAAVGGWDPTENAKRYSGIFRNEINQNNFVKSVVEFLKKYNFDGMAMHWAHPGLYGGDPTNDKKSYSSILEKMKREFLKHNLILIAICHGIATEIDNSYIPREVGMHVDYLFLLTYDLYGEWSSHLGIAGALYLHPKETDKSLSADSVISKWINLGAEPSKIIMGIQLFGRSFTLKYENQTEPGSYHVGPGRKTEHITYAGLMSYIELCSRILKDGWTVKWEDTQKVPYAFKDDQWVGFENERSLEIKSKYVIDRNLAGIATVFVEDDDFRGICGEKNPRLKLLNGFLRSGRDSQFEYIINVSVFKKSLKDQYTQCVYHTSEILDLNGQ